MYSHNDKTGGYRIINLTDGDIFDELQDIYNNETRPLLVKGLTKYKTSDHYATASDVKIIKDENGNVSEIDISVGEVCYDSSKQKHYQKVAKIYPSDLIVEEVEIKSGIEISDATKDSKGIVQVGNNIDVTDGVVSVPVATNATKGVVQVGDTISVNNGVIDVSIYTLNNTGQTEDGVETINFTDFSNLIKHDYDKSVCLSAKIPSPSSKKRWICTLEDENTFFGFYKGTTPIELTSSWDYNMPIVPEQECYLIHKTTIGENTYYISVPVKVRLVRMLTFDSGSLTQYLTLYIKFTSPSASHDYYGLIPDNIEVGSTYNVNITYASLDNNYKMLPLLKNWFVNIQTKEGFMYTEDMTEVYVKNGKGYTCQLAVRFTDTDSADYAFATYTFTRVF